MNNTLLIIDDTKENIDVLVDLLSMEYMIFVALDGKRGLALAKKHRPDLILLDVMMPEMDGFEVCRALKADMETEHIPVLFITAMSEVEDEAKGIRLGAVDYIRKPFNPLIVKSRIRSNLAYKNYQNSLEKQVRERTAKIEKVKDIIIKSMGVMAEFRDPETGAHIKRTQYYVKYLAEALLDLPSNPYQLNEDKVQILFKSAPLHDIGKVSIPDDILLKPGRLTDEEYDVMKTHTYAGKQAILSIKKDLPDEQFLNDALEIAYTHHERWDGSGYPCGLKEEEIPISGRIMALADVYDALISKRVYKEAYSHEKAKKIIVEGSGKHFDPQLVEIFLDKEEAFREISTMYQDSEED